jgi:SWI/SNF-related matrix-associated actin-dependent regulator 1 of chromatin subfamily A
MTLKERLTTVLKTVPRDFQIKGIEFLEATRGRALLGDDMGLGKTLQVLGYLALHPEITPVIIVCPSNSKYEWLKQIEQHTKSLRAEVVSGRKPYPTSAPIIIINYDILTYWADHLIALTPAGIVMDECHYVKDLRAARTIACQQLSAACKVVLPLSGTPIINRPSEFFPVLNMIQPQKFSSFWRYAFRYCSPKRAFRRKGWDFSGSANTQELHNKVAPIMLRRMKSEVLTELPPKQRIPIFIEISNRREYEKARDIFLAWYKENYGVVKAAKAAKAEGFVRLGKLRQLVAKGKIKAVETWINDYLESTDGKLVVFACHRAIFDHFATAYKDICACGGGASEQRHQEIVRFQNDPKCRLFVGTIKADNQAITLTAANAVLFIEQGWTPGEHDQAEDRINRIGQKADSITAYYFLGQDSVDEYIWKLIEQKREIITKILDGEEKWTKLNNRVKLEDIVIKI